MGRAPRIKHGGYDTRKKAGCVDKRWCNDVMESNAPKYARALILDTGAFVTSSALVRAHPGMPVVCPQSDKAQFRQMRRNLRTRDGDPKWVNVSTEHSTFGRALEKHRMFDAPGHGLIWLDAMCLWDSTTRSDTSPHHDFDTTLRQFSESACEKAMFAVTVSTHGPLPANAYNHRTSVVGDMVAAAFALRLHLTFTDELPYAGMYFVATLVEPSGAFPPAVGDRVLVPWSAHPSGQWEAALYPGVVDAVCGKKCEVVYSDDTFRDHPVTTVHALGDHATDWLGSCAPHDFEKMAQKFAESAAPKGMCAVTVSAADRGRDFADVIEAALSRRIHVTFVHNIWHADRCFVACKLAPSDTRPLAVGDNVVVPWRARAGKWPTGLYSGVVAKINDKRCRVSYDDTFDDHPIAKVRRL
jgi:hypothetical protein